MKEVEKTLKKNGLFLKQIKRNQNYAIYEVSGIDMGTKKMSFRCYELHKIRISPKWFAFGKEFPESEKLASNEEFGSFGWSFFTKEGLNQKLMLFNQESLII